MLGWFWFNLTQQRPYYAKREIRRGKKKGWLEVSYLDTTEDKGVYLKRIKVPASDIIS
jgi:hypothetical protein